MNALIILLVTLTGLGGQPTAPVEPKVMQKCIKATATILRRIQTMTQADPSFELRGYSGERAIHVLEAFSANPPPTQYKADQIVTLVDAREDGNKHTLVMLITTGCMTEIIQTPRENWRNVLSNSIGSNT
ncbi:hypothetical protein SAMN05519103_06260 [Rhizobiales bacterium GAS113]|nr:hypothetical protein SAMN05519103_06260 [Rhizobiales bacterium GAS113]